MRPPLAIRQNRRRTTYEACMIQVLYMLGIIKVDDINDICRRPDWPSARPDTDMQATRIMLELGVYMHGIGALDPQQLLANGLQHLTDVWRAYGVPEENIYDSGSGVAVKLAEVQHLARCSERSRRMYPSQVSHEVRLATPAEAFRAAARGRIVGMTDRHSYLYMLMFVNPNSGEPMIFDPTDGRTNYVESLEFAAPSYMFYGTSPYL